MTPIEQAMARLDDIDYENVVKSKVEPDIQLVLGELRRLKAATANVVQELRDDPAQWSHDLADKLEPGK